MKSSSILGAIVLSIVSTFSVYANADEKKDGKAELVDAIKWASQVLGTSCDFSQVEGHNNLVDSHYFEIKYRDKGQDQDSPDNVFPLYELLCARGGSNADYIYLTKGGDGYQLLSFAEPSLDYDYTDETFSKLKAPPKIRGYTATSHLANAEFSPEDSSISMHTKSRSMYDIWSSGTWTFVEGAFVLSVYDIDPTSELDAPKDSKNDPARTEYYQVFPAVALKSD